MIGSSFARRLRRIRKRPWPVTPRRRLEVEGLETRTVPTIVFNPIWGAETVQSSAPFATINNPTVYLILWGSGWAPGPFPSHLDPNYFINRVQDVLGSHYLDPLQQYGNGGFHFFSGLAIDTTNAVPANFRAGQLADASLTEAEQEISGLINSGALTGPAGAPPVASAPIYVLVTDPEDSHPDSGPGTDFSGGDNASGTVQGGAFDGNNINIISVGTDSSFFDFSVAFSSELADRVSDPTGARPTPDPVTGGPPAGSGVIVSPGVNLPDSLKDDPADLVTAEGNWGQVADFEATASNHYDYWLGGGNGTAVQAYWSAVDRAFIVDDGTSEVFDLSPVWDGTTFTNTYDLTINGDQLVPVTGNANDTITISGDGLGGVQVDLNGQVADFVADFTGGPATQLHSITVNGLSGTNTLNLDFSNGYFVPGGGITFDAGSGGVVNLMGDANFNFESYQPTGPESGAISIGQAPITFQNVSVVNDTLSSSNFSVVPPVTGDQINIINDPNGTENGFVTTQINSGTGAMPPVNFANKAQTSVAEGSLTDGVSYTLDNPTPADGLATLLVREIDGLGYTTQVLATAAGVTTDIEGGASDTVIVGNGHTLQGIAGLLNVEVPITSRTNTLTLDDGADPVARIVTMSPLAANPSDPNAIPSRWGTIHGLAPADIRYQNTPFARFGDSTQVTVDGGTGGNTFLFSGPPQPATTLTINGGLGVNSLVGPNRPNRFDITGVDQGDLDGPAAINFSRIGRLIGGQANDTFAFSAGAGESAIDGGGGNNTVIGPPDRVNTFRITGANAGNVPGVLASFIRVGGLGGSTIPGNTGTDLFDFFPGGRLSGKVAGGSGSEWLNYDALATAVRVNLAAGSASGAAGGVTHLPSVPMNVIGSAAGGDVLIGDSAGGVLEGHNGNNTIVAGSGRTIIIGGYGKNELVGGAADDLIIDGSTAFDLNVRDLACILAEWRGTKLFATRVNDLRTGSGLAGGHALVLNRTVFIPPPPGPVGPHLGHGGGNRQSTLVGNGGQNWFFTLNTMTVVDLKKTDRVD